MKHEEFKELSNKGKLNYLSTKLNMDQKILLSIHLSDNTLFMIGVIGAFFIISIGGLLSNNSFLILVLAIFYFLLLFWMHENVRSVLMNQCFKKYMVKKK